MRHKVRQHQLDWTVASAGTESYHIGEPPHRLSQKICLTRGIDISHQRAIRFTPGHFARFDKIYAFATDVHSDIIAMAGKAYDPARLDFFLNELYNRQLRAGEKDFGTGDLRFSPNASVPDPYYGGEDGYSLVYDLINATCDAIIENYK
jgi:protein-tyrosine phosphatase